MLQPLLQVQERPTQTQSIHALTRSSPRGVDLACMFPIRAGTSCYFVTSTSYSGTGASTSRESAPPTRATRSRVSAPPGRRSVCTHSIESSLVVMAWVCDTHEAKTGYDDTLSTWEKTLQIWRSSWTAQELEACLVKPSRGKHRILSHAPSEPDQLSRRKGWHDIRNTMWVHALTVFHWLGTREKGIRSCVVACTRRVRPRATFVLELCIAAERHSSRAFAKS